MFSPNPYAAKKDLDFGVGAPSRSPTAYPDDPWNTARFTAVPSASGSTPGASGATGTGAATTTATGAGGSTNGVPSSLAGTGLPRDWWKKQETATVSILGQQGFILNRYTVYNISTSVCVFCFFVSSSFCLRL
jgi:sorting nexin-8